MTPRQTPRAARLNADLARQRMEDTLAQLKLRVEPARLRHDATTMVRHRTDAAVQQGVAAARRHPGLIAGGAIVTLLVVARRPIAHLVAALRERRRATTVHSTEPEPNQDSLKGTHS